MYNYGNYNPYANQFSPYNQNSIQQLEQMRDQLDAKIQTAQQQQQQSQQQQTPQIPQINQSFQLAPTTNNNSDLEGRYAENIDEVKNTFVMKTGIFATKDFSTIWQKDVSGNIRTFKTEEIVPKDEKDIQIQQLQEKLSSMEKLLANAIQQTQNNVPTPTEETSKITTKSTKK